MWIPSHVGLGGNELVDERARQAVEITYLMAANAAILTVRWQFTAQYSSRTIHSAQFTAAQFTVAQFTAR
jgi:hypothetical protein